MDTTSVEKPENEKEWFIVKFDSDGVVRSVPKSLNQEKKCSCFILFGQTSYLKTNYSAWPWITHPHENSWQKVVVEVLASAKTIEELRIKELMAQDQVTDIDALYKEDEGKMYRKVLKKKKLEENFTSGQEYTTTAEESEKSYSKSDNETLETPEKSMFGTKDNISHSAKRKHLSTLDGKTKTQSPSEEQDIAISNVTNEQNDNLEPEEVNEDVNTSFQMTSSFGQKPFFIPTEEQTQNYSSARSVRRAAKEDEKEMEDNEEENNQDNPTETADLKQKSAPADKSVLRDEKTLANKKYQKTSVTLTDVEIDGMDVKTMFKVLYHQNEEVLKSNQKLLIEIKSIPAMTMATSTAIQFMKHPFQITTLKKLHEIEEQLEAEKSIIDKAADQDKDKVLPADSMTNQVLNFFNAQGGSTGHKGLCNILRNSLADEIQVHFNMKGKERKTKKDNDEENSKLAFEELQLWRLMKDVVVTKYIHVDNYSSDKATTSCSDWLKGAAGRIRKAKKKTTKKIHQNAKLKEKIRKEAELSDN